MATVSVPYTLPLGSSGLYPPVSVLTPNPPTRLFPFDPKTAFTTIGDVIAHYTQSSLACEGIGLAGITVTGTDVEGDPLVVTLQVDGSQQSLATAFGTVHQQFLVAGFKAQTGVNQMKATNAWNPMSGFQVNGSDGLCEWSLCLPLGMAMLNQKAVILMHYPPYIAMQNADYLHNNTLSRWQNLLVSVGIDAAQMGSYTTIVDVNPIAAPGSGQSEYPNDYFPIMMSSLFFDNPAASNDYIRTMVGTLLNPNPFLPSSTYPLLVCGAPTYDPQAPGWFRVAYKAQLPQVATKKYPDLPGIVQANVMQAGTVFLTPSASPTPYMIVNHMIAAGVIGRMTGINWSYAADLPDIRQFEAQDLVAAEFLRLFVTGIQTDPYLAKQQACQRWYGNTSGTGVPTPPADADKASLCAMALVDTYFDLTTIQPCYTLQYALSLVAAALPTYGTAAYNPCDTNIYPPPAGASFKTGVCAGCPEGGR